MLKGQSFAVIGGNMRFFEVAEQPELTGKDLKDIVVAAFGCDDMTIIPDSYCTSNIEFETRLKFNSPTPVMAMELVFNAGRTCWQLELLYWEIDGEWEVTQAVKKAEPS